MPGYNQCNFLAISSSAGFETISAVMKGFWELFILPAKFIFSILEPKFMRFFEVDCFHEFGWGAGIFSGFVWLLALVAFITALASSNSKTRR